LKDEAMFIKDVLREELDNSLHMKQNYEQALAEIPKGSLVRRIIKGHPYYYLVFRENGHVRSVYKGKLSKKECQEINKARELRAQYRRQLSEVKKQIRFLRKVLRGKEAV
jgi:hypothetical protein